MGVYTQGAKKLDACWIEVLDAENE